MSIMRARMKNIISNMCLLSSLSKRTEADPSVLELARKIKGRLVTHWVDGDASLPMRTNCGYPVFDTKLLDIAITESGNAGRTRFPQVVNLVQETRPHVRSRFVVDPIAPAPTCKRCLAALKRRDRDRAERHACEADSHRVVSAVRELTRLMREVRTSALREALTSIASDVAASAFPCSLEPESNIYEAVTTELKRRELKR